MSRLPLPGTEKGLMNKLKLFGYDKFVAMTSGTEAADATVKIAQK
jgi:hypothetical protein